MDYDKFFDTILSIDSGIRFVGLYLRDEIYSKMQPGISPLLTRGETRTMVNQTVIRNSTRQLLTNKLGRAVYSTTRYEKLIRSTIPINKDDLILISMEANVNHCEILNEVIKVKDVFLPQLIEG